MKRTLLALFLAFVLVPAPTRADDRPVQPPAHRTVSAATVAHEWITQVLPPAPPPIDAPGRGREGAGKGDEPKGDGKKGGDPGKDDDGREPRSGAIESFVGGLVDLGRQFVPFIDKHVNTRIFIGNVDEARREAEESGEHFHQVEIGKWKLPIAYGRVTGCFSGDATVETGQGALALETLFDGARPWGEGRGVAIRALDGLEVAGPDGLPRRALAVTRRAWSGAVVVLEGEGVRLLATPNHEVLVRRDGADRLVRAEALRSGDVALRPLVPDLARLLGRGPLERAASETLVPLASVARRAFAGSVYNLVVEDGSGFLARGIAVGCLDRSYLPAEGR